MELYCEDRFINFPASVEFQLNGRDAGEFEGFLPNNSPIGTPPETWEQEWNMLNQEIFSTISDSPVNFDVQNVQEPLGSPESHQELDQHLTGHQRRSRAKGKLKDTKSYCVFCCNNKESREVYMSHRVKDAQGRVTCPRLFNYECPICKKKGAEAHTVKYCPKKTILTPEMAEMQYAYEQERKNLKKKLRVCIPRVEPWKSLLYSALCPNDTLSMIH
ncbi:nanos homolog 2-like [Phlebotomus papatasi]|uniref:nanos homolog 2-like n=1 Tax=Phlebotomus papatasi TaxID=29031 RepID=UPI002483D9FF|nr:nanos homolog 2-like [Phlebotomus papatasi]